MASGSQGSACAVRRAELGLSERGLAHVAPSRGKAIVQGEQAVQALDPSLDLVQVGLEEARGLARMELKPEVIATRIRTQLMVVGRGLVRRIPDLGRATLGWLDQYQKGKLEVSVDMSTVTAPMENVSSSLRKATVALLISGMIIGSAIATTAFTSLQATGWSWVIPLGAITFGLSMLYGAVVAWRLVREATRGDRAQ